MEAFTVSGEYAARDGWQSFEISIEAPNEGVARERVYANMGSQHRLRRSQIELSEVSAG